MEDLRADWATIRGHLQGIQGFDAKAMERFFEEGPAKKGIHFFLVRYDPGEVIMMKGTTGDYAALHVQGRVRVRGIVPAARTSSRGCWSHPMSRRLENLVLNHAPAAPVRGWRGWISWPLAWIYRSVPELPLRLLAFAESWYPPRVAERWRRHLARVLNGRLPRVRRAERDLSNPQLGPAPLDAVGNAAEKVLGVRDAAAQLLPAEQRFMGIAGTLWNQPRSVTLVADNDPADDSKPCVMLLIKRKALEEIIKKAPAFFEGRMQDFVDTVLPDILTRNRLFQDRLFAEDVLDWNRLLAGLSGRFDGAAPAGLRRVRGFLDERLRRWLPRAAAEQLDGADRNHIIGQLNMVLARRDLAEPDLWPDAALDDEARAILRQPPDGRNDAEVFRLNRLLLAGGMPGVFASGPRPAPLTGAEFRDFTTRLAAAHRAKFGKVLRPERLEVVRDKRSGTKKGVIVCKQGDPADAVMLLLSGMVRVSLDLPGGQTMVNNVGADTCFGESAILDSVGPDGSPPRRTATLETQCDCTLLRFDRDSLRELCQSDYRALADKLGRERQLLGARDEQMRAGRLLPPSEPPLAIAERLVLTRNLLLIDMHKCTRCDQCVRGCAEAHDLQPRFHRANPELRFGKWEVAGACLHCLDAPCQQACPVGAITLLEDAAVQIHRDRCIGCSQCANECPFNVIDMYEPTSPADAPSSKKGIVANKCDLCLTEDRDPPCVACCPYDAAQRVAPAEFFPELRSWAGHAERS
jgi:Fe-S-cluster-containing hydrogenase component 2/CRP-like cAMP-binding protein